MATVSGPLAFFTHWALHASSFAHRYAPLSHCISLTRHICRIKLVKNFRVVAARDGTMGEGPSLCGTCVIAHFVVLEVSLIWGTVESGWPFIAFPVK